MDRGEGEMERERERVYVCACEGDDEGWRTRLGERWVEKQREREREEEGSIRTKDKECGSQGVTRISFDGITWRLRVGTVITLVVYR